MKKFKSVIVSILITLSFVLVVGIISSAAIMTISEPGEYLSLISGAAQLVWLVGAVAILKLRKVKLSEKYGLTTAPLGMFILPTAAGLCFSVFSNLLQEIIPIPQALIGGSADVSGGNIVVFIAAVFIIAPITEEFLFRGLIITRLRSVMNAIPAVLISTLLFGVIHLMTGSVITGIHALIGGVIFGLAYEKSGSLFTAITAHIAGNIGGLIPCLLQNANFSIRLIAAILSGIISITLCLLLIRKSPAKSGNQN